MTLRACLKILNGTAAGDFGCGQGGEVRASPQRAVTSEPTQATGKSTAARRVDEQMAAWLRCSSVTGRWQPCSFVAPRHPAICSTTVPFIIFRQALSKPGGLSRDEWNLYCVVLAKCRNGGVCGRITSYGCQSTVRASHRHPEPCA